MLKFLIDHNVPKSVGDFLKKLKYGVKLVKDVDPEMTDVQVLDLAKKEGRIIVSNDKGLKKILPNLEVGFGVVVLQ